ncbi:hypothetical protein GCM10010236_14120 [Streptomyces eurythermus]|nr:hypothetical protein GCM10010236_14120 [Streptomyces eurythermus]
MAKDGANMARSRRFNARARGNNPSGPASGPGAGTPHTPTPHPWPTTTPADPRKATSRRNPPPGAGTSRAGLRRLPPPGAGARPLLPGGVLSPEEPPGPVP